MSIVSVVEKLDGTRSGSIDKTWQRTYTRTFIVETSDPNVGPIAVRAATGIPPLAQFYHNGVPDTDPLYEHDFGSFVSSIEATLDPGPEFGGIQWTVKVEYTPYDMNTFGSDPTLWKIKVQFGGEKTERVVYFDRNGDPIRNSAGDPFDPPITFDDSRSTMTVTRNELVTAFDLTLAEQMRDSINDAVWNGFAARTVKCGVISTSEPQYDSNAQVYYYTVTYPFEINRDNWKKVILDAGMNEISGSVKRPIMDAGQPVSDPVPLDGSGHKLAVGGTPVTITVEGYKETDFSIFNIDLSLRLGA